jgi:hypothetical protein
MTDERAPPIVAFPVHEIKKICKDTSATKILAASHMKLYAAEVGLEMWKHSQMPLLGDIYSYSNQLYDFLIQKVENPTEEELLAVTLFEDGENAIPFLKEEIMMMSGVVSTVEKSKKLLLIKFNISFEVH